MTLIAPSLERWQVRLRGLTLGAGTDYDLTGPIGGLGALEPRTTDRALTGDNGATGGLDTLPPRSLYIPLAMHGRSPAGAMELLRALKATFAPNPTGVEDLDVRLPGLTGAGDDETLTWRGRPRGIVDDLELLRAGEIAALARFDALDPLGYGTPVTGATTTGTARLRLAGDWPTRAAVFAVAGNGARPVITSTTDDGRLVAWATPLPDGATRVVDLYARTVTTMTGVDRYGELDAASTWFRLLPGANTLAVAGAAELSWSARPAYT
jgi:hypothetical protein